MLGYPCRAMRTRRFLYIRNFRPDRWPAGDPEKYVSVGPFGDVDGGPTKDVILNRREEPAMSRFFRLSFDKRPAEELYDLGKGTWRTRQRRESARLCGGEDEAPRRAGPLDARHQ